MGDGEDVEFKYKKVRKLLIGITLETGAAKNMTIKGIRFITDDWNNSDILLFQNNSAQTVIFEDLRCMQIPRAYRNGKASYGKKYFSKMLSLHIPVFITM